MLMTTLTALTMMMVVIKSGDNLVTRIYVMMTLKWIMPMVGDDADDDNSGSDDGGTYRDEDYHKHN